MHRPPGETLVYALGAAMFVCATVYGAVLVRRYAVTLHPDAIELTMAFRHRRVLKADIVGWADASSREGWAGVVSLELKNGRRVQIPLASVKDSALKAWFASIPNSVEIAAPESLASILADHQYGATPDARLTNLTRERRLAGWFDIAGCIATLWVAFWPSPYVPAIVVGLLFPAVAFGLAILLQDRWDFTGFSGDQRPTVFMAYLFPTLALVLRAMDYRLIDFPRLVLVGALIALIACLLLFLLRERTRKVGLGHIAIVLVLALYGYSVAVQINARFGPVRLQHQQVEVLASEVKSKDGKLTLAPWGPFTTPQSAEVSVATQRLSPVGAKVYVTVHTGLLGARWWTITPPLPERAIQVQVAPAKN